MSVVVARKTPLLRDTLKLGGIAQHRATIELADQTPLDLLPWRLILRKSKPKKLRGSAAKFGSRSQQRMKGPFYRSQPSLILSQFGPDKHLFGNRRTPLRPKAFFCQMKSEKLIKVACGIQPLESP